MGEGVYQYPRKPNEDNVVCREEGIVVIGEIAHFPELLKAKQKYFRKPQADVCIWSNLYPYMSERAREDCLKATWEGLAPGGHFINAEDIKSIYEGPDVRSQLKEIRGQRPAHATLQAIEEVHLPYDRIWAVGRPIEKAKAIVLRKPAE